MTAHGAHAPERPSLRRRELTPEIDRLILRTLAKDPASRPTMSEVAAELAEHSRRAGMAGLTATPVSPGPPAAAAPVTYFVAGRMRDTFGEVPEGFARRLQAVG
jgi:hypothetical protein